MATQYRFEKKLGKYDQKVRNDEWTKADCKFYGSAYKKYTWEGDERFITARNDSGELLGFVTLSTEGGVVWIEECLVFEKNRKQGIGTKLLTNLLEEAKRLNCHKIILETNENLAAMNLYKKFGFNVEARLKDHYAHLEHVLMSLFI